MSLGRITFLGSVLLLKVGCSNGIVSPNVSVTSCTSHRVVIRLDNAADGGLIYIQGRSSACKRTTYSYMVDYEFDFDLCSIKYDSKFRVIVQRNPYYQTGYDKVIPVMCLVDTADLVVSSLVFPEEVLDRALNKTVRPTVRMRMLTESNDVTGGEIMLNDKVKMSLTLDDPYTEDFDLKAKECTAALIPLLKDDCSTDEELFPNFEHMSKGDIATTFRAFQPTNLHGETEVDVAFTCNVAVCKGDCKQAVCGEIVGWGRKKRNMINDDIVENVTCGTTLRVKTPSLLQTEEALKADYCVDKYIITSVAVVTAITLVFSWVMCGCVCSKLKKLEKDLPSEQKTGRKLSDRGISMARAVGRRLSSMLQLPVGYDVRRTSIMDTISEADEHSPPSKRRESVTVSTNVDDTKACTCRLRASFVYRDSNTQTSFDDFEMDEAFQSSQKEKQSLTSNITYYNFDMKSVKLCLPKSDVISVLPAEINAPPEPAPDYHDTSSHCAEENRSQLKTENDENIRKPSYSLVQEASYDVINDDNGDPETKYRSVLNICKTDKDYDLQNSVITEFKNNLAENISTQDKPKLNDNTSNKFLNTPDESFQVETSSDEYDHESVKYPVKKYPYESLENSRTVSSDSYRSNVSSSESLSYEKRLTGSSVSSVITICDENILSDDVFELEPDYEPTYETIDIGAQLRVRGESINSTHV